MSGPWRHTLTHVVPPGVCIVLTPATVDPGPWRHTLTHVASPGVDACSLILTWIARTLIFVWNVMEEENV